MSPLRLTLPVSEKTFVPFDVPVPKAANAAGPWRKIRTGALVLLVLLGVRNLVFYRIETREYPPDWGGYFASLKWIGERTPASAIVVDRKPGFVEFVARRRAVVFIACS